MALLKVHHLTGLGHRRFVDEAIQRGDEIWLVSDPFVPNYYLANTYQRELTMLRSRGFEFREVSGGLWVAERSGL